MTLPVVQVPSFKPKQFTEHIIEDGFYGQEIEATTYNLARMNMFLHNINYDNFSIERGNTLLDPKHGNDKPFDAIVSNPPYSIKWIGSDDPTLINDDRFAPAGFWHLNLRQILPLSCIAFLICLIKAERLL